LSADNFCFGAIFIFPFTLSFSAYFFLLLRRRCSMDISSSFASYDTRFPQPLTSDLADLSCGGVALSPGACAADVLSSAQERPFSADTMSTTTHQWPLFCTPSFLRKCTPSGAALLPDAASSGAMVAVPPEESQPRLQRRSMGQEEEEADSHCSLAPYLFTTPAVRLKNLACTPHHLELPAHVRIDSASLFAAYYSSAALALPLPCTGAPLCGEHGRGVINDPLLEEWAFVLSQEEDKNEFYTGMDHKDKDDAAKVPGEPASSRALRYATRKREARAADTSKATAASAAAARSPSNAGATATALNDYSPRLKHQLSQVDIGHAGRYESSDDDGGTISEALIVSGMLMGNPTTAARTGPLSPQSSNVAQTLAPTMHSSPLDQTASWSSPLPPVTRRTRLQVDGQHLTDGQHPARHDDDTAARSTALHDSLDWSHDGKTSTTKVAPFIFQHLLLIIRLLLLHHIFLICYPFVPGSRLNTSALCFLSSCDSRHAISFGG
jgi:hypothetical protein